MKRFTIFLLVCNFFSVSVLAQWFDAKQDKSNTTGLHYIDRFTYLPLPGTEQPDKSKLASNNINRNSIIAFNEAGRIISIMDYEPGTTDKSGPTKRYYWDGPKLIKEVQENDAFEVLYSVIYTYDASDNEIKAETKNGPADNSYLPGEIMESAWDADKLIKLTRKNEKGSIESERTYTYDSKGMRIKEVYSDKHNTSTKTFVYDSKGNKIKETDLDKDGNPSYIWEREYDKAGNMLKVTSTEYYQGKQQSQGVSIMTYDTHGGRTSYIHTENGKTTNDSWKHTYDNKGNRIQTVRIKEGKVVDVEVLKLLYYPGKN